MATPERLTLDALDDYGCITMLGAMLTQMSRDFQSAYAHYLEDPYDAIMYLQYDRIRKEFLSEYFHNLTHLNGREIVTQLEQKVREDIGYISQ